MEKVKWSEKVTNDQVLESIGEKRTLLSNILRRKVNWISHRILRRNCLLHDRQMTGVKVVGRRRTRPLEDLRNRRRYCEFKEEAKDRRLSIEQISP